MEKNKFVKPLLLTLTLAIITSMPVFAEDPQTLEEVVVTGTRVQERTIDVPVSTEVITPEKIEMSGAVDIGDLIGKYVTGHYHKYNGLLSPVGMRGFRTESHGDDIKGYVLILIDGHRLGTGNAAKINLNRIERVEVIKGPASALYGSAAMGGVINLITKKGDSDLFAKIGGEYGSFDYHKGQISSGGRANDKLQFHLTASYEDINDYHDPDFGTVHNSGVTKKNIGGNLLFVINDNQELRVGGNYADLTSESSQWEDGAYSDYLSDAGQHNDKSHGYADMEYNGEFMDGQIYWRGLAYYLWDRNHWNWGYPVAESYQSKYTDKTLGTDHQLTWKMTNWNSLLFGFNLERLEKESEAVAANEPSAPYIPGMEYNSQALFLQDSLDLWNNRVNVIGAVRYDRFEVETLRPKTGDLQEFNDKSESYDHFSPKIGAGVKFFDELLRIRANVGEGFKTPSADQLSADYVHSNGTHYLGNPDLDPETSLTYDVGFDIFHDNVTFKAGYFHSDYEDKIVSVRSVVDDINTTTYENHGDAESAGFDVSLEWWASRSFDLPFDLSLWSNATFNTTKEDKETGKDLLYISDYEIKSGLDLKYPGLGAQLNHVLVGPQMITNYDTYEDEEKDRFDFWDLTMRYQFPNHWEAKVSVLNLFNDRVEWVRGYPMSERSYRVGISYTF